MKNNLHIIDKLDKLLTFLVVFVPRCIISMKAYPFVYVSDETSAISIAALVAGFEWKDVVSHAGYYGIGYLWIYAPLFHILDDSVLIYRVMLVGLSATVSISGIICHQIMTKFFDVRERIFKFAVSSFCGLLSIFVTSSLNVRNEEILYLIIWMVAYVLCSIIKNNEEGRHNLKNDVLLLLLLIYSLTIHTRAICLVIGVFLMDIILRICKKNHIMRIHCYPIMAIGYLITKYVLSIYQSNIWINDVKNASVTDTLSNALTKIRLFDIETYLDMLRIALGQIYTACIMTGGFFIVAIIILIIFFVFYITKKEDYLYREYILVIGGIFLFCTLFTIAGQSMTWLPGVYKGTTQNEPSKFVSAYRAFAYMRYMGGYVAPYVMCACILLLHKAYYIKLSLKFSIVIISALTMFWIIFIHPFYQNYRASTYLLLGNIKYEDEVTNENYFRAYLLLLTLFLICFAISKIKNGITSYLLILVCLLSINRVYIFGESTQGVGTKNYQEANTGYNLINKLEEDIVIKDIYVYDATEAKDHNIFYTYQFLNFDKHIIPDLPDQEAEGDTLLFSNKKISNKLDESYQWCKLDNNEYVYAKGDSIKEALKACGVEMQMME